MVGCGMARPRGRCRARRSRLRCVPGGRQRRIDERSRLADTCYLWAFAAITASPGARAFDDQRRAAGDTHHKALRALGNRLVGILHGCLRHHTPYDEHTAWAHNDTPNPLDSNGLGMSSWDLTDAITKSHVAHVTLPATAGNGLVGACIA